MSSKRRDDPLAFAAAYPFDIPGVSYVLANGKALRLVPFAAGSAAVGPGGGEEPLRPPQCDGGQAVADWRERVPVIACGSNRAPSHLGRKFAGLPGVVIPVVRARLSDFDVVYSAHFTPYGAIPATLCPSRGARAEVSVAWPTPAQLARLHASESVGLNYAFCRLRDLRLELEIPVWGRRALSEAFAYVSLHGCLAEGARPVSLAAVAARGRAFPALRQVEVLRLARDRLAPGAGLEEFVGGLVADEALRESYVRILRTDARLPEWPRLEVIEG